MCARCEEMTAKVARLERHNRVLGFGLIEMIGSLDVAAEHGHTILRVADWARSVATTARAILKKVHDDR